MNKIDRALETGKLLRDDFPQNLRHSRRLTRRQLRMREDRRHRWTLFWRPNRPYHRPTLEDAQTHSRSEVLELATMHLVKTVNGRILLSFIVW